MFLQLTKQTIIIHARDNIVKALYVADFDELCFIQD